MNKNTLAWIASAIFSLATGISQASAQDMNPPAAVYTQADLDQILAPVALYPDALLAQVLMAATYPLQVVQAARFMDSRPGLHGDALAGAVAPMPWDPSVKSLTQFPSVLAMMNDKLDWTQDLGDAFLSQQANVMDTVQNLRVKAQIAGNLRSTGQQRVLVQDQMIEIMPVDPQIIYVPYYNPVVVYGSWWWPQQPPLYWAPPPRYRPPSYNVSVNVGIAFGVGVGIVHSVYTDARPDWRQHHVVINNVHINNTRVTNNVTVNNQPTIWQHSGRPTPNPNRPHGSTQSRPTPAGLAVNAPAAVNPAARPEMRPESRPESRPAFAPGAQAPQRPNAPAPLPNAERNRPQAQAPAAMPAAAARPNRPEPERRAEPQATPRPQAAPRPQPAPAARQERPEQHEQRPVPQARPAAQPAPRPEQHREAPHPEQKPKPDEHKPRPDDK